MLTGIAMIFTASSFAQNIDINAGYGMYQPAVFPGYGASPGADGIFYSSAGKTSGTIPAGTAMLQIILAPEIPWNGQPYTIPPGWELDPSSTPTALTFINSTDWTTEDPYFEIPVTAIAPRTSTAQTVATQVSNIGGDWIDDGLFNVTPSAVQVTDTNLPVTLISFNATREGKNAQLSWATSMETNSDRFEIQRSPNGKTWNTIASVESAKESVSIQNYFFTDKTTLPDQNLYRLKMVDKDETFAYSRIRSITMDGVQTVGVFPNPASDLIQLDGIQSDQIQKLEIVGLNGVTAYKTNTVDDNGINVAKITPGAYLIKITNKAGSLSTQKIIIQR